MGTFAYHGDVGASIWTWNEKKLDPGVRRDRFRHAGAYYFSAAMPMFVQGIPVIVLSSDDADAS